MATILEVGTNEATIVVSLNHQGFAHLLDASQAACTLLQLESIDLLEVRPEDVIEEGDLARLKGVLDQPQATMRVRLISGGMRRVECELTQQVLRVRDERFALWILRDRRSMEAQARLKEVFASLAHRLSAVRTPREAAVAVTETADMLFGWDACHLNLYPEGRDQALSIINIDTVDGIRREFPSASPETPISPMSRRVMREGPQLISISPERQVMHREMELVSFGDLARNSASLMFVPIRRGKRSFGVLSIQSYQPNKYRDEDIDALQVLADHCAGTFERLLAEEKLHRQIFLTNKFADLGKRLSAASSPREVADVVIETADDLFGWDSCYVTIYSEEEESVEWVVAFDLKEGRRTRLPLEHTKGPPGPIFREVLARGAKLILRSGHEEMAALNTFGDTERRSRSLMFAPMRQGVRRVGLVSIQSYTQDAFTFDDLHGLQALADHCAGALTRAFAEESLRNSEERLRLVTSQLPTILWTVDLDLKLTMLLGESLQYLDVDPTPMIGQPLRSLLGPYGSWESGQWMHERALLGHSGAFELTLGDRTFFSHVEPLQDRAGSVIGCINVAHDITARRLAEEDLRKFKKAIEQAPGSVIIMNAHNLVEYVNPAFEMQTGFRASEVIGRERPFESIGLNPADFYPELKRALDEGEPYRGVVTARRKNGQFYFEGKTITPLTDQQGTVTHYVETGRDITEKLEAELARQRAHDELELRVRERTEELSRSNNQLLKEIKERRNAEEELERSLSLLRATLESTTDGIMVVDLQGHLVSFNQKWLQMWEISFSLAEDMGGPQLHQLLADQLRDPAVLPPFTSRRSQVESFQVLHLIDGRIYECYSKASMIGGKSVGRVWSFRDITQRRRAEEALARSERIYRQAIENASGVPYRWDYKTRHYDFMGDGIRRLLGLEAHQVTKQGIEDMVLEYVILEPDAEQDIKKYRKAVRDGRIPQYRVDLLIRTASGEEKWVNDCSVPMRDQKTGEIVGTLGILQDITERKRAEEQARIQQERLIQSEKLVALGTLVSGVAHEINNPNNFIMLNAPVLLEAWENFHPVLDEYFDENGDFLVAGLNYSEMRVEIPKLMHGVLTGAQRIRSIVQELRDFARPNPRSQREPVDVNAVVKSALILLHSVISNATTRFSLDCSESLPVVLGNFQRMEQVVINLIHNACQSLPSADCAVRVRTYCEEEAGYVVIEVTDEGCGISPEHMKQITDPFFTTKRDSGGTGLGLSISSNIVHNHGGILEFTSQPGEGTTARAKFVCGSSSTDDTQRISRQ